MKKRTFTDTEIKEIAHNLALSAATPQRSSVVSSFIASDVIKTYVTYYNAAMDELEKYNTNPTDYTS